MELAFGPAPRATRWKDCRLQLVTLAQTLQGSAPPRWVGLPAQEPNTSLLDNDALFRLDNDDEDENFSFPPLDVDSASLAGPSTSISTMAPGGQVAATATSSTPQQLPAASVASAVQITKLQSEFGEALTITGRMSTAFFFIEYLTKSF